MQFSLYLVMTLAMIGAISFILSATYRHIEKTTSRYVFTALLLVMFSLCCFSLSLMLTDTNIRFFFHELKFLTLAFLAPCSLITYMEFTGKGAMLNGRTRLLLCVIPAITAILALTNNYHHFFRLDMYLVVHNGVSYVAAKPSWWYWVYSVYSYMLYCCGVLVLSGSYFRMPRVYRDQTGILVATVVLAISMGFASIMRLFPDYGDASLIFAAIVCMAQYAAIVRYSRRRVTDKCRSLVLSNMSGYVLIYNHKEQLVDAGEASPEQVRSVLEAWEGGSDGSHGRELRLAGGEERYSLSEKRLLDERGRPLGRALLLSDITEMKKAADELEYTATHDYLTGLSSRNVFHSELRKLGQEELPAALIYACASDMKLIVGIFGYEYADKLIVQMTEGLRSLAGEAVCARLNGNEMGIILKGADAANAEMFIAKAKSLVLAGRKEIRLEMSYTVVSDSGTDAVRAFTAIADAFRGGITSKVRSIHNELLEMLSDSLAKLRDGTGERAARVADTCRRLAGKLGLNWEEAERLNRLAALADIGLLSAEPVLVHNIGNLTNEQWEEFKLHTMRGYSIALSAIETEDIAKEILSHHERYDGYGYPKGLKADEIPINSRIYAAAEFYADTPPNRVGPLLRARMGTQFDPDVVCALLELAEES